MCQCYQIGGPWIAEDPSCPLHGTEATRRQKSDDERIEELTEEVAALKLRMDSTDKEMEELRKLVASINSCRNC